MPSKQRQFLQAPIQLSLFDLEQSFLPPTPPTAAPNPSAKPAIKRRVLAGQQIIEYCLRRSKRRSIGFLIEDDGLRITAPRWITIAEIEDAIREKHRWIIKKLDEQRKRLAQRKAPEPLGDGATLNFLGTLYTVRVQHGAKTAMKTYGAVTLDETSNTLTVLLRPNPREDALKTAMERWLQQEAKRVFLERLPHFSGKIGVTYRSFALSGARTQWGSCTAGGALRLNWRLVHLPLNVIDYVIAHELSHLREMNHSSRFWATVEAAFPEYEEAQKILRKHSPCALSIT